jgi:hypothetical protein
LLDIEMANEFKGSHEAWFAGKLLMDKVLEGTLNQRVPGSRPGAPTKLFNSLRCPLGLPFRQVGQRLCDASPTKRDRQLSVIG